MSEFHYFPRSKAELRLLVKNPEIHLGHINTAQIRDMAELFVESYNPKTGAYRGIERTDFSGIGSWDVSHVETMAAMFAGCVYFNEDLRAWNTANVTNMEQMFAGCVRMNQPIAFDSGRVTNMRRMFYSCVSWQQSVKLATRQVTNMEEMFAGCELFNARVEFDTNSVVNLRQMFAGCRSFNQAVDFKLFVRELPTPTMLAFAAFGARTPTEISCAGMFAGCASLNSPVQIQPASHIADMSYMFSGCTSFNQPVTFATTQLLRSVKGMMQGCVNFNQPLQLASTQGVNDCSYLLAGCRSYNQEWNLDTRCATNFGCMFAGCSSLRQNLLLINPRGVNYQGMFAQCDFYRDKHEEVVEWAYELYDTQILFDQPLPLPVARQQLRSLRAVGNKYQPHSISELRVLLSDRNISVGDLDLSQLVSLRGAFAALRYDPQKPFNKHLQVLGLKLFADYDPHLPVLLELQPNWQGLGSLDLAQVVDLSYAFAGQELGEVQGELSSWNVARVANCEGVFCSSDLQRHPRWYLPRARNIVLLYGGCFALRDQPGSAHWHTVPDRADWEVADELYGIINSQAEPGTVNSYRLTWTALQVVHSMFDVQLHKFAPRSVQELRLLVALGEFSPAQVSLQYLRSLRGAFMNGSRYFAMLDSYALVNNSYNSELPIVYDLAIDNLDLGSLETAQITDMSYCFLGQPRFNQRLFWDLRQVTTVKQMFGDCLSYNQPVIFDTPQVVDFGWMLSTCQQFNARVRLDTRNARSLRRLFKNCTNFNQPVQFDTRNVRNMEGVFCNCYAFNQRVDFNMEQVTNTNQMFAACKSLNQPLDFNTCNVVTAQDMFSGCSSLRQTVRMHPRSKVLAGSMCGSSYLNIPFVWN